MSNGPCRECGQRWVRLDESGKAHTCHENCPKYKDFKEKRETVQEKRKAEKQADAISVDRVEKAKRRGHYYKDKRK